MLSKMCDEHTQPLQNVSVFVFEVSEYIRDYSPHFVMDVVIHPCWDKI